MKQPQAIERQESELRITWKDGSESKLSSETIRRHCPSAESKAKRGDTTHDKPLGGGRRVKSGLSIVEHSLEDSLRMVKIWPVGRYAIGIEWGDGLKSGIYSYSFLASLAEK